MQQDRQDVQRGEDGRDDDGVRRVDLEDLARELVLARAALIPYTAEPTWCVFVPRFAHATSARVLAPPVPSHRPPPCPKHPSPSSKRFVVSMYRTYVRRSADFACVYSSWTRSSSSIYKAVAKSAGRCADTTCSSILSLTTRWRRQTLHKNTQLAPL